MQAFNVKCFVICSYRSVKLLLLNETEKLYSIFKKYKKLTTSYIISNLLDDFIT